MVLGTATTPTYGITAPYTIPKVFLPTNTTNIETNTLSPELTRQVARLNNRLRETLNLLHEFLLPLSAVREQIILIRAMLNEIYEATFPDYARLGEQYTMQSNRDVQNKSLPDFDRHHLEGYIVYDEYFSIIRVPEMTAPQLLCQCVATTYALLGDLPYTMLAREEVEVLFMALYKMFHIFLVEDIDGIPPVPAHYVGEEHRNLQATEVLWNTLATDNLQRRNIAMFRWLVGHHLFDLITIFLTRSVHDAVDALQQGDEETVVTQLDYASTFLRAGIACEWYAANFSSQIYSEIVRPSMAQQDVPGGDGFSGDQNAEFNRFKHAKEVLKRALRNRQLSPMVEQAVRQFVEMYVQDMEHHVLLASAMAGNSPSIAQEEWQKGLPEGQHVQSAVDFLRDMVSARRAEFSKAKDDETEPILEPAQPLELNLDETIIATVDELAQTNLILKELDGESVLIGRTNGEYWAVSATCTHKEFPISEVMDDTGCLVCTKHGARFTPQSGELVRGPVGTTDLPTYEVVNDNGVLKIRGLVQKESPLVVE